MSEEMSKSIEIYFDGIDKNIEKIYEIANNARKKGFDPEDKVDIPLAKGVSERVESLIGSIAPCVISVGIKERIKELEQEYEPLDWRVAFKISGEIAQEKFCKFKNDNEAMEIALRVGFAYLTLGVVSAPLEGFMGLKIKKRRDGKDYISLFYSGPVRGAGGTAAAVSVILGDYLRKIKGYDKYDPSDKEIKRYVTEILDYHERVTNLQYFPSEKEVEFLVKHIPIEINGDPTEKFDVSNYKDLERVETNKIRGGICLVLAEGVAQKATKLFKRLEKWGKDFDLEWDFLKDFLDLQKKIKAKDEIKEKNNYKILPDYTYISDLVAGRPVLSYPLTNGGFRLRYGRCRVSGYSSKSISPNTMNVLDNFIAIGTQLKIERPGKGAAISSCDTIDGPIVKLKDGSVFLLDEVEDVKQILNKIDEIIYLGDILINYGDFSENNHNLIPVGYCVEWWIKEVEKATFALFDGLDFVKLSFLTGLSEEKLMELFNNFFKFKLSASQAIDFSLKLKVPLHPRYTYFWKTINNRQLKVLYKWFLMSKVMENKIVLPLLYDIEKDLDGEDAKRILELIGIPHKVVNKEYVVIDGQDAKILNFIFKLNKEENLIEILNKGIEENKSVLWILNEIGGIKIRDKCGTFIGARMGRPEKAKIRKMTGSPHVLFPVGDEGGRLRCFGEAIGEGKITGHSVVYGCNKCGNETVFSVCEECGEKTQIKFYCDICNDYYDTNKCESHGELLKYKKNYEIDICKYYGNILKKFNLNEISLVKGVRGMSNKDRIFEYLGKGILRSLHNIYVNKDGTVRYDMTEMAITHFKPKEIYVSVDELKKLGYLLDYEGKELINEEQLLEIKPQDVILPNCFEASERGADEILFNVANFVDEELEKIYGLEKFYNLKDRKDLIGQLIIGLAPHTSAGIIGRIIGFSDTQVCFAHPMWHASMRRDCDGDECAVILLMDALLNFSRQYLPDKIGGRSMDSPLVLSSRLIPSEVDDMVHGMDVVFEYPLELYEAALEYKKPSDVKIKQLNKRLNTKKQYEDFGFTHDTNNFNSGVSCSAYKFLPTMEEKVKGQMIIAEKIRAVNEADVAKLIIEKHFIKDIKGNLRKFSMQQFRCSKCNEKYRRPPLKGLCLKCNGNLMFTISEGSIVKYLEPAISLSEKYTLPPYLVQSLDLIKSRIESVFGREEEKQIGLSKWF